jgi:preprotein translocase subunit SecG
MLRMGLTIVQLFAALAIIALVLLQRGKGADAGAGFGAGASGTVFGARGARTALSRATAIFAAIFMLNSLAPPMGTRQAEQAPKTILTKPRHYGAGAFGLARSGAWRAAPAAGEATPPAVEAPQSGAPAPATGAPSPSPQQ